ncbi:glucosamine-6-phosphate deaminase [Loktanella sp. D2R18]|uniref:glucosamine-6-phosphate deaminase n=1 Tax=Rhodobacterales TaxID=204455 RepID=UPI000DE985BA|nr:MULTISPECIES: glucosamine-6-phosphate deaminase [Rhodobacterales]MDO6591905.1 glucosamine-6-phosphate deaminase [Yoonia sp. 1_MG-2023]RBW42664.1 glucosamine-6-phosphate deaminase [Loktanella sp. D2R18]
MIIKTFQTPIEAEHYAADLISAQVRAKPNSVMGWATGGTMLGVYKALCGMDLSFKDIRAFNLDEYIGLPPDHPQSYHFYMRQHLFDHIDISPDRCHLPVGIGDTAIEISRYQDLLRTYGPIDLQLLGIGQNGHIGFNEPGADLDGLTRKTALSPITIRANSRYFGTAETVPNEAITMGIGTIMTARKIVLLGCGASKADAVAAMIQQSVTPDCPASVLQRHDDITVVLDKAAAASLSLEKQRA